MAEEGIDIWQAGFREGTVGIAQEA
jgi:hypothetical protein